MNAFELARPKSKEAPSPEPRRHNRSAAPSRGLVMNSRGFLQAPLEGRARNSISLEGQAAGRKSTDKRSKLKKAAI